MALGYSSAMSRWLLDIQVRSSRELPGLEVRIWEWSMWMVFQAMGECVAWEEADFPWEGMGRCTIKARPLENSNTDGYPTGREAQ